METQLTVLEHKIDQLLATVASAHLQGSEVDEETTQTIGHVTGPDENRSEKK